MKKFDINSCILRIIQESDASLLVEWFNDHDLCQFMDDSEENKIYNYNDIVSMMNDQSSYYFSFLVNKKLIGYASLYDITEIQAEFSFLIGNRNYHSKGLGTKLLRLLEKKAIMIGIKKLFCYIYKKNLSSIRCVEKIGYLRCEKKQLEHQNEVLYSKTIS